MGTFYNERITLTNKHLNPQIIEAEGVVAAAKAAYEDILNHVQATCSHDRVGEFNGQWTFRCWGNWRVCFHCGLAVDAQGCGFWATDPLFVEDKEDIIRIENTQRFYQLRKGNTLTKEEARAKNS